MDWSIWIVGGIVAILVIGAAWWTSEQRRGEAWRDQNREHADALGRADGQPDDHRNAPGST
jgi:FtsZ-interacting cell division protein ZipA